ncbi:MFS transporter [Staphylococcus hominis]
MIFISLSMFFSFINLTILFFLLNSIFSVIYKASLSAMIIEATSDNNRRKVFGYNYWLVNLSVALGISMGGIFFKEYSNYMYLIAGTATLIISIIYYKYMKSNEKQTIKIKRTASIKKIFYSYSYAVKDKSFVLFILSGGIIFSSEWHLTNIISVELSKNNIMNSIGNYSFDAINTIALLQVINTIIILSLSIYVSKYMERFKVKYILLIGTSLYSLAYVFMLTTNNIYFMILLVIVASLGELIFAPSYQVAQVDIMDLDKKGSYSALGSLATHSSSLIASLTLMVSQYINIYLIFIILALLSIIAILILYNVYNNRMERI